LQIQLYGRDTEPRWPQKLMRKSTQHVARNSAVKVRDDISPL